MKKTILPILSAGILFLNTAVPVFAEVKQDEVVPYLTELIDYIEKNYVGEIDSQKLIEAAMKGITSTLDEYSVYYTVDEYSAYARNTARTIYTVEFGFDMNRNGEFHIVEFENGQVRNDDGLRVRDRINSVNGVSTQGLSLSEMKGLLITTNSAPLNLNVTRGDRTLDIKAKVYPVEVKTISYGSYASYIGLSEESVDKSVGYIKIDTFGDGTADEFRSAISALRRERKTKLILDLRGNTGGYVDQAISICNLIVPNGTIITTKDKSGNLQTYKSTLAEAPFSKIVVLVDDMTASASEIIASALQDSGAGVIVGEQTFGKGVMQSVVEFGDVGTLRLTMFEYFTRNGKKIDGVGIKPDYEVEEIMFVQEDDKLTSKRLKDALIYLGYSVDTENDIIKSIGKFQISEGLDATYKLNSETVSKLNLKIFERQKKIDDVLMQGYLICVR